MASVDQAYHQGTVITTALGQRGRTWRKSQARQLSLAQGWEGFRKVLSQDTKLKDQICLLGKTKYDRGLSIWIQLTQITSIIFRE